MKKIILPALLSFFLTASGQTYNAGTAFSVYKDIPDTLLNYVHYPYTNETYGIDLFDSPSNDIEFTARGAVSSGGSIAYINVRSLNKNLYLRFGRWDSVYVVGTTYWHVTKIAKPFAAGEPINLPDAKWDTTVLYLTDHSGQSGGNKDVNDFISGDKYLGLKYDNGRTTAYGWIRVECTAEDSCYIKDFSHTLTPVTIQEIGQKELLLYPNPGNGFFYLHNIHAGTMNISKLKIVNMYGEQISFSCEINENHIKINPECHLPAGCYLLQYVSRDRVFSHKLIKSSE